MAGTIAHAETPLAALIRVSGLRPGKYVGRAKNPEVCLDGDLTMRDDGTGLIIVMMGVNSLLPGVGHPEVERDKNYHSVSSSEVSQNRIVYRKDVVSSGTAMHFETTLTTRPNGFDYVIWYRGKFHHCALDRVR